MTCLKRILVTATCREFRKQIIYRDYGGREMVITIDARFLRRGEPVPVDAHMVGRVAITVSALADPVGPISPGNASGKHFPQPVGRLCLS